MKLWVKCGIGFGIFGSALSFVDLYMLPNHEENRIRHSNAPILVEYRKLEQDPIVVRYKKLSDYHISSLKKNPRLADEYINILRDPRVKRFDQISESNEYASVIYNEYKMPSYLQWLILNTYVIGGSGLGAGVGAGIDAIMTRRKRKRRRKMGTEGLLKKP